MSYSESEFRMLDVCPGRCECCRDCSASSWPLGHGQYARMDAPPIPHHPDGSDCYHAPAPASEMMTVEERQFEANPVRIKARQTQVPLDIKTLEGVMHASPGDWIITGTEGEQYPCKPSVFARKYRQVTCPNPHCINGWITPIVACSICEGGKEQQDFVNFANKLLNFYQSRALSLAEQNERYRKALRAIYAHTKSPAEIITIATQALEAK